MRLFQKKKKKEKPHHHHHHATTTTTTDQPPLSLYYTIITFPTPLPPKSPPLSCYSEVRVIYLTIPWWPPTHPHTHTTAPSSSYLPFFPNKKSFFLFGLLVFFLGCGSLERDGLRVLSPSPSVCLVFSRRLPTPSSGGKESDGKARPWAEKRGRRRRQRRKKKLSPPPISALVPTFLRAFFPFML